MSFSFSFSGDDVDDNADQSTSHAFASRLTSTNLTALIPPKHHTPSELLQSLPSQISYNWLDVWTNSTDTSNGNGTTQPPEQNVSPSQRHIRIPRRSLFDIRQQLMAESDPTSTDASDSDILLAGLETGDLSTGIYEGGFKTWECAVDLAGFLAQRDANGLGSKRLHVIELGAGSAVPSLEMLGKMLRERRMGGDKGGEKERGKVRFTLCDYNEDVLRLCTAVNVFLVTVLSMQDEWLDGCSDGDEEGDLEVDEDMVHKCLKALDDADIEVDFISGAWGQDFSKVLQQSSEKISKAQGSGDVLVLASETIYAPDSLHVFSKTVLDIVSAEGVNVEALVAAKKVYFGVGGGVPEFEEVVRQLGGSTETVLDVPGAGVGRVVLQVSRT